MGLYPKLSIGNIWFGRKWPPELSDYVSPKKKEIFSYLSTAILQGIKVIDTAPAYGTSEKITGLFLKNNPDLAKHIEIWTKWGAEYDQNSDKSYLNHSIGWLKYSFRRSISHLSRVDGLFIHGTNLEVLKNQSIIKQMVSYKKDRELRLIGASLNTNDSLLKILEMPEMDMIQIPPYLLFENIEIVSRIHEQGKLVIINSPVRKNFLSISSDEKYQMLFNNPYVTTVLSGTRYNLQSTINLWKQSTTKLSDTQK